MRVPRLLATLLTLTLAGGGLAAAASAQVAVVRASGCPGAPAPIWSGSPTLGECLSFRCPSTAFCAGGGVWLIGLPLPGAIPLPAGLGCVAPPNPCLLNLQPVLAQPASQAMRFCHPPSPALIGFTYAVQLAVFDLVAPPNPCVRLSLALNVTIQR